MFNWILLTLTAGLASTIFGATAAAGAFFLAAKILIVCFIFKWTFIFLVILLGTSKRWW